MSLLNVLSSPDWRERKQAIEALAKMDDASLTKAILDILREHHQDLSALNAALQLLCLLEIPVISGLLTLLEDPDPDTRTYAALALGESENEEAIPALMKALDDPNLNVRFNAIEALGKLRARPAVEKLLNILRTRDFYLAFPALRALANIGDPRPVPDLLELIKDDLLCIPAAQALGKLGSVEQAASIIAWLETSSGDVPTAVTALTSLGRRNGLIGEEISRGSNHFASKSGHNRQSLIHQIVEPFSSTGRDKLLAKIPSKSIDHECISRGSNPSQPGAELAASQDFFLTDLAYLLGWLLEHEPEDIEIVNALAGLLDFPPAQQAATEALAHAGEAALPGLQARLASPEPQTRHASARALASIGLPAAIPVFISVLDSDDDELVALAVEALGRTGDPATFDRLIFEPLISKINHSSAYVRRAIATVFSSRGLPQYTQRFLKLLSDANPVVRETALRCLANPSAGEEAVEKTKSIMSALEDPSPIVRKAAVEVLPYLESEQAFQALAEVIADDNAGLRAAAARSLAHSDPDLALPYLHRALTDPDPWVRLYACRSLARHARLESISHLAYLIYDPLPPVRIAVAEALGDINGPQALTYLQILIKDAEIEVRQAAEKGLGRNSEPASGTEDG